MNTYKYDIDTIIKRSDELDEKKSKIVTTTYNDSSTYPSQADLNPFFQKRNKVNQYQHPLNPYSKETTNLLVGLKPSNNTINQFANVSSDFDIDTSEMKVERIIGNDEVKHSFVCREKVLYQGTIEFTFLINSRNYDIFIGFMADGTDISKGASTSNASWMVYLLDGGFINGELGQTEKLNGYTKPGKEEGIFTLLIDTKTDEMSIKVNNSYTSESKKLVISDEQKAKLLPCFEFREFGDKIAIF